MKAEGLPATLGAVEVRARAEEPRESAEMTAARGTEIHNLLDREVTLVLEDRVPVSEDERVVVQIDKVTTPGYKDSPRRPGVKLWTLELAPGETREIVLAYRVRYPRELRLQGLD